MPQQQKRKPSYDPTPQREESERKDSPIDKELEDLNDQADKIIKRNKEKTQKKQPSRQ